MASYRVVCITKPNVNSSHEHITEIGYYESALNPKRIISVDEAIRRIKLNKWEFYVSTASGTAYVEAYPHGAEKYIKTIPDSTTRDNLLKLDQCSK